MKFHAIILVRCPAIKNKNLIHVNKKPLLYWSIRKHCHQKISKVWVSSDSHNILNLSKKLGTEIIKRPKYLTDKSSSEDGWLHAIKEIKKESIDYVIALQATSP